MSEEWYLMGTSPVYGSGFEQEEFDLYGIDSFDEVLNTFPIAETVQLYSDIDTFDDVKAIVQNTTSNTKQGSKNRQILVPINTLKIGNKIKYRNNFWIVTTYPDNNKIYEKAIIEQCNYQLKFQNSNGDILTRDCIFESNLGSLDENNIITTLNNTGTIKLSFDSDTSLLKEGQRLIVDNRNIDIPNVYKISNVDTIEGHGGIVTLTLNRDEFNSLNDRKDLGVCDYFEIIKSTGSAEITYSGSCEVKIGGSAKTFTANFIDGDGVSLDLMPVWDLIKPTGYEDYFTVTIDDTAKTIKVKCDLCYDDGLIGQILILNVTDSNNLYSAKINITVVSL